MAELLDGLGGGYRSHGIVKSTFRDLLTGIGSFRTFTTEALIRASSMLGDDQENHDDDQ